MKGLFRFLPPFAADISGVCAALIELDGIVVVHEPSCCTGAFTVSDEPRWYGTSSALYSSELRDAQVASGDDETLLRRIEGGVANQGGEFIAIVGSPVPMVMASDYQALARLAEQRTGIPAFACDVTGTEQYDTGASVAFLELARRFVEPTPPDGQTSVNIIGATPLDLGANGAVPRLTAMLEAAGCRVNSCWAMGSRLEAIARSARAGLNLVVSHTGLAAARHLENRFGTPYLVGLPIGHAPSARWLAAVRSRLGLTTTPAGDGESTAKQNCVKQALVIAEQVMGNSLRQCLRQDLGVPEVTVASFFGMEPCLAEPGDVALEDEQSLIDLAAASEFGLVVGDPLFRELTVKSPNARFIALPHLAVSGWLHWHADVDFLGEEGYALLKGGTCTPCRKASPAAQP